MGRLFLVGGGWVGWWVLKEDISFTWKLYKNAHIYKFLFLPLDWDVNTHPTRARSPSQNKKYCYNELLLLLMIGLGIALM